MAHDHYRMSDHKAWEEAGLEKIMQRHEMTYVNQEDDYGDCQRGEWFVADDETKTIIYGTFGNYNSPGAWDYTYADVYDEEDEYSEELAHWEGQPEYVEQEEEEEDDVQGDDD